MTQPVLIYLHGFLSAPASEKAQETIAWMQANRPDIELIVPTIANTPDKAAPQLLEIAESVKDRQVGLIGSSMGGFFSAWLSAQYGFKAALINPGTYIADLLQNYIGEHENMYSGERFTLTAEHVELLREYAQLEPDQSNLKVLLQTGDETLDYRDALKRFPDAQITVEEGGNHRFEGYKDHLPDIIEFLGL